MKRRSKKTRLKSIKSRKKADRKLKLAKRRRRSFGA